MSGMVWIHMLGVIVWVGGMFFAHVCLRPVVVAQLAPPQRLPLLAAVLGRFFTAVGIAIAVILFTGFLRYGQLGGMQAAWHWQAMAVTGSVMTAIFLVIALRYYPRLKAAVAKQDWPAGGAAMDVIRQLVLVNLILGVATVVLAGAGN